MSAFTISVSSNTITIGDGTLGLKNTDMPVLDSGGSATTQWVQDIFFSFYTQTGTPTTFIYTPLNLTTFTFTAHDYGMMLANLFPNLYSNSNYNTIQTEYPEFGPNFARLRGTDITVSPSYGLKDVFEDEVFSPLPATATNAQGWVFTDYGIGTKALNANMSTLADTNMTAVHLTSIDPITGDKTSTSYDAVSSNLPNTIIIYTNLFSSAFSNGAYTQIQPFQFLAIWAILSRISLTNYPTKNPIAYINTLTDTFWLRRGTSTIFTRDNRKDANYGCFGNYLLSVMGYNPLGGGASYDIPIVPAFGFLFEYGIINYIVSNYASATPSVTDPTLGCLYNAGYAIDVFGNKALRGNVKAVNDSKVYRRLMMFYCAAVEKGIALGNSFGTDFIANTEVEILNVNPSFPNVAAFYQAGANFLQNGEYAYFFKYMSGIPYASSNLFNVFVAPYILWSANVLALPNTLALKKAYKRGQSSMLGGSILNGLTETIHLNLGIADMTNAERQDLENYSYPP
jgi:hypothetical protein